MTTTGKIRLMKSTRQHIDCHFWQGFTAGMALMAVWVVWLA